MREFSFDQLIERDRAEKVPCGYCGAKPGARCFQNTFRGDTRPVENITAHLSRINRATRARAAEVQAACPHDSWSGDEGPVRNLGRMPRRWTCDGCGITKWENA